MATEQQIYDRQYYLKNRTKRLAASKQYRIKHMEKMKLLNKAWRDANPLRLLELKLKSNYGITVEQREIMRKNQKDKCAVCSKKKTLCIDHNHKTGKVRALVCRKCNTLLSAFDDKHLFRRMINYVKTH